MTEPVAARATARRTVRVAIALVTGQALLCGVIGWLTFGSSAESETRAGVVDVQAAPTMAMPTPSLALPPVSASPSAGPSSSRPAPVRSSRPPSSSPAAPRPVAPLPPSPDEPATVISPRPPRPAPTDLAATPNAPDGAEEEQGNVVVGEPCDPEGARGRTADDVALRCVRGEDGRLTWQPL